MWTLVALWRTYAALLDAGFADRTPEQRCYREREALTDGGTAAEPTPSPDEFEGPLAVVEDEDAECWRPPQRLDHELPACQTHDDALKIHDGTTRGWLKAWDAPKLEENR